MASEFVLNKRIRALAVGSVTLAAIVVTVGYAVTTSMFSAAAPSDIAYFQGKWSVTNKAEPDKEYTWTVSEDLKGEWLSGVVERSGDKISTDLWRVNAGIVERYSFTSDGLYIQMAGYGWKSGKMVMNGLGKGKAMDFRTRETITRESDRRFRAVWERQGDDGKWFVYSDETYSK